MTFAQNGVTLHVLWNWKPCCGCLTSPLTMRTLASHHPHGSLSLALEYTCQHTHILKALITQPLPKITNDIRKEQQHSSIIIAFMCRNGKNEAKIFLLFPTLRIVFSCISSLIQQLELSVLLNTPHVMFCNWSKGMTEFLPQPRHSHLSPCRAP